MLKKESDSLRIGRNMKRLRVSRGWTQKEVAKMLKTEPSTYSRWEGDVITPNIIIIMDIARLYGVSLDELCSFKKESNVEKPSDYEMAISRIKEMGIKFTEEADTLKFDVYGSKYEVNVSDLPNLIDKTDAQHDVMLIDANKSLYKAAMAVILNSGKYTFQLLLSDDDISTRVYFWLKEHKEKFTPYVVVDMFRHELIVLSSSERKIAWDYIIDVLTKWDVVDPDDVDAGEWECPMVDL